MMFSITACRIDLVFLLASSFRDTAATWTNMINFVTGVVNRLRVGPGAVQVGLVTYGTLGINQFYLSGSTSRAAVLSSIQSIPAFSTLASFNNLTDALGQALNVQFTFARGDRPSIPNVVVVLTGQQADQGSATTLSQAQLLKNAGIQIYGIAVNNPNVATEISAVVSSPNQLNSNYYYLTSDTLLPSFASTAFNFLCPSGCAGQ